MNFPIQSVSLQKYSPTFAPRAVSLQGGWKPLPLPMGPVEQETLGIAMAANPDIALGQGVGARLFGAGTAAILTLPSAATAYVGFSYGSMAKGFPSILGYLVGTMGALGVLFGLLSVVGAIALPSGGEMVGPAQRR